MGTAPGLGTLDRPLSGEVKVTARDLQDETRDLARAPAAQGPRDPQSCGRALRLPSSPGPKGQALLLCPLVEPVTVSQVQAGEPSWGSSPTTSPPQGLCPQAPHSSPLAPGRHSRSTPLLRTERKQGSWAFCNSNPT